MPSALIRGGAVATSDPFTFVALADWPAHRGQANVGVRLAPTDDPAALAPDLAGIPAIAVQFPKFTDGRGYSIAFLLRKRYAFAGELRAEGDVMRDTLFYLKRAGFDAFLLKDGKDGADALGSFADFTTPYQASADGRTPVFRLREGAPQ